MIQYYFGGINMCGIAGFSSFDKDYTAIENYFKSRIDILKKMRQSFAYRGNDQTGECLRRNVGFSHTRDVYKRQVYIIAVYL